MRKQGSAMIAAGLLLIAGALVLTLYNVWDGQRADAASRDTVAVLWKVIPGYAEQHPGVMVDGFGETDREFSLYGLFCRLFGIDRRESAVESDYADRFDSSPREDPEQPDIVSIEISDEAALDQSEESGVESEAAAPKQIRAAHGLLFGPSELRFREDYPYRALFSFIPDREMPTVLISGNRYIGVLDIPDLALSLPVMEEWDYDRLKVAPCRFTGSVYLDNLVICAHNYPNHFSPIKFIPIGTQVIFTDVDGMVFRYVVSAVETVGPDALEQMIEGDWSLTLFTCNTGGQTRCAVRCDRIQ